MNIQINEDWASQVALVVKNPPANAGAARDMSLIPGSGRSPGVGSGSPMQRFFCLENSIDKGAWQESNMTQHKKMRIATTCPLTNLGILLSCTLTHYVICHLSIWHILLVRKSPEILRNHYLLQKVLTHSQSMFQ